ncbi:hypothetical protein [Moraxella equi]|uniref:Uncharacterized protein n=1 Tax=Moraxella equi TaxID=60442 RepID=A0ABX3NHA4_9GAMM|nr:hypothetical protein [Moraxella equi]OPH37961.1 hypothetical protein B5J93_07255 [Moraxella equi]
MGILDDKSALTYHKCERLAKYLLGKVGICADWFYSMELARGVLHGCADEVGLDLNKFSKE